MPAVLRRLVFAGAILVSVCAPGAAQQQAIKDSEAAAHVGEVVTVEGVVAGVYTSRRGNTFLNFGGAYPNQTFAAVVFRSAQVRFKNLEAWEGKHARVTGRVKLYRGKPEIIVESAEQLTAAP